MAVSGSKDYAVTRATIIEGALRKLGVYDQGESIPGAETSAAAQALNVMIKEWAGRGIDLWLRQEVTLFLQPGTASYSVGSSGSAHATTSFAETTLSADEATSATVIDVTSSSGMTAADNIGIKLDDDSIHWTTIVSVDSATQVTITTGIASAATSGNKVYAYTTKAGRPQRIMYAYRRDTSGIDTEVELIGENEYQSLSDKTSEGPPVALFYRPTLDTGTILTWPTDGGSSWDKLVYIAKMLPDDFDAQSNNPQFPIEWANALIWGLAADLGMEYGLPRGEVRDIWQIAEKKIEDLRDYDVEYADVQFGMEYDR